MNTVGGDRIAIAATGAAPPVVRRCGTSVCPPGTCDHDGEELPVRRHAPGGATAGWAPPAVNETIASAGQPLDTATRALHEQRFGFDFGSVRVHADSRAAQSAAAIGAHAYSVGNHVVFGAGRYRPGTPEGGWLIAHELAHVRQERGGPLGAGRVVSRLAVGPHDAPEEHAADRMADEVMRGRRPTPATAPGPVPTVRRLGVVDSFLRLFGVEAGDFSVEDLTTYLTTVAERRRPSEGYLDDDMAREIVKRGGVGGPGGYKLSDAAFAGVPTVDIKRILILEMLSGPTTGADEQAIFDLLRQSTGAEISTILDPQLGLSIQAVESDVPLEPLYAIIDAKLPDLRKQNLTRGRGTATQDASCTAGRAVQIDFAHKRGIARVERGLRMLDAFASRPAENKNVERVIGLYFNGAKPADLATIRQAFTDILATIPLLQYRCPAEPFTGYTRTQANGQVEVQEAEPGLVATSPEALPGAPPQVLLFPDFFEEEPAGQARVVVHEAFHHARRQAKLPEFYGSDAEGLAVGQALTNADSYAQVAGALAQEGLQLELSGCPVPVQQMALAAARRAEILAARAVSAISGAVTDEVVLGQLRRHFKVDPTTPEGAAQLDRVRGVFATIQAGFGEKIQIQCEETCPEDDTSVELARVGGVFSPSGHTIHLCPAWVAAEPDVQAHTILHEMGHRAAGLGSSDDIPRRGDLRRYNAATAKEAAGNADAYASFADSLEAMSR